MYGFIIEIQMNLTDFARQYAISTQYNELFRNMRVPDAVDGGYSQTEWKIANLYQVLVFRKIK